MESSEVRKMDWIRGAARVQIAVTSPVVIRTTSTQPGTSPLSFTIWVLARWRPWRKLTIMKHTTRRAHCFHPGLKICFNVNDLRMWPLIADIKRSSSACSSGLYWLLRNLISSFFLSSYRWLGWANLSLLWNPLFYSSMKLWISRYQHLRSEQLKTHVLSQRKVRRPQCK